MTKIIKKAIVIGASGLVGRALVQSLHELGQCEQITVIVRHPISEFEHLEKSSN